MKMERDNEINRSQETEIASWPLRMVSSSDGFVRCYSVGDKSFGKRVAMFVFFMIPALAFLLLSSFVPFNDYGRIVTYTLVPLWGLKSFWSCFTVRILEIAAQERRVDWYWSIAGWECRFRRVYAQDGDRISSRHLPDGEEGCSRHLLYLHTRNRTYPLVEINLPDLPMSESVVRTIQVMADLLRVENAGYDKF